MGSTVVGSLRDCCYKLPLLSLVDATSNELVRGQRRADNNSQVSLTGEQQCFSSGYVVLLESSQFIWSPARQCRQSFRNRFTKASGDDAYLDPTAGTFINRLTIVHRSEDY
jgi:hypothetical protein